MAFIEPLIYIKTENWKDLQRTFTKDWPTNIPGYYILEVQRQWIKLGLDYGFKVYCPYGDVENGMVAVNNKAGFNEIVIQCGNEDTSKLEEALVTTKMIDWSKKVTVPYAPLHVVSCVKRALSRIGTECRGINQCNSFIIKKGSTPFEDICLPSNVKFENLQEKDVETIDAAWPYRYSTSQWYFRKLISVGTGYGIFENNELAAWVLVNEGGSLCNLFTLDNYRRKGYAEILLRKVTNILLEYDKDIFVFCIHGNVGGCNLYRKLKFEEFGDVAWCFIKPKE